MKKLIMITLCAALVLSLRACGEKDTSDSGAESGGATTSENGSIGNIEILDAPEDDDLAWGDFEIVE